MNILHIIFSLEIGGAETMLIDIANEQASRGHNVEILIINNEIHRPLLALLRPEVRVTEFNRKKGTGALALMLRLNYHVLRYPADAIHLHDYKLPFLLRTARRRAVFTVHDVVTPLKYAKGMDMAAISDAVRVHILENIPNAKVRTITNGIRTDLVAGRQPSVPAHTPVKIVQVGRLVAEIKGCDILIRAIALLKQRGISATATFIGDGPDMDMLRQLARTCGVEDRIIFTGALSRSEIYAALSRYEIMCHPARFEGFGLTVAEGMAAGLPLVVPEYGGPWEIADKGRLCRTFINGDADSCADALQSVIEDYADALAVAELAKAHVRRMYSVETMVDNYLDFYTTHSVSQ